MVWFWANWSATFATVSLKKQLYRIHVNSSYKNATLWSKQLFSSYLLFLMIIVLVLLTVIFFALIWGLIKSWTHDWIHVIIQKSCRIRTYYHGQYWNGSQFHMKKMSSLLRRIQLYIRRIKIKTYWHILLLFSANQSPGYVLKRLLNFRRNFPSKYVKI